MARPEKEKNIIEMKEGEDTIAYCSTCRKIIFKGTDKNPTGRRVLRTMMMEHFAAFEADHQIDVIYPNIDQTVDGIKYLKPPFMTDVTKGYLS